MQAWTIEMDVPMIDMEPLPPTRRAPRAETGFTEEVVTAPTVNAAAFWFMDRDEAPTRIDGKVRVFGEPMTLTKRNKRQEASPKHPDGPGPSLESVISNFVGE